MSYASIFDAIDGEVLTEGLESAVKSDAALHLARRMAKARKRSVVVEDHGLGKSYRITPAGKRWRVPHWWGNNASSIR
jgi:hypothetical protein